MGLLLRSGSDFSLAYLVLPACLPEGKLGPSCLPGMSGYFQLLWGVFIHSSRGPAMHQGRVALLGDSAHAMQPNLGQGGCMAIEDGYQLAVDLSEAVERAESSGGALDIEGILKVGGQHSHACAGCSLPHTASSVTIA